MIYLDSSALLKLVRLEDETAALRRWLDLRPSEPVVCSELGRGDVLRLGADLGALVAYDHRLTRAARAEGLVVHTPGV